MFSMNNSGIAAQQNLQTLQESENRNKKKRQGTAGMCQSCARYA